MEEENTIRSLRSMGCSFVPLESWVDFSGNACSSEMVCQKRGPSFLVGKHQGEMLNLIEQAVAATNIVALDFGQMHSIVMWLL